MQRRSKGKDKQDLKQLLALIRELNALKAKFSRKYKRTFRKVEECSDKDECLAMTNEMYLSLMQRVLKTAGVDQGAPRNIATNSWHASDGACMIVCVCTCLAAMHALAQ